MKVRYGAAVVRRRNLRMGSVWSTTAWPTFGNDSTSVCGALFFSRWIDYTV
jgi:hypothetical protein